MNNQVSYKTIYNCLYSGLISKGNLTVLRQKGKRHKAAEKHGKFLIGTSISKRPKEVNKRESFGHWELDTVVSSRGKGRYVEKINGKKQYINYNSTFLL